MPNVYCENSNCIYYGQDGECLCKNDIRISDNYYDLCSEYSCYTLDEDYQELFWKAITVNKEKGKYERRSAFGKRILINGREFFTESNPTFDEEHTTVTDGETGAFAGSISFVRNKWEGLMKYVQYVKENRFSNVLELPIADDEVK